jgi:tetratricopeptide (TPR) repeat protein
MKMKTKKWLSPGVVIVLAVLMSLSAFQIVFAQLEELEPLGEQAEVKCIPDSLTTYYDRFKSDSISEQQINIWYSLAREEFKYKNYKRAIPYYWKVLVNDTTGKFRVAYSKLADCYYNLNQPDSVFIVCYRGLEKYPDQTRLHYWAGYLHDILGQTKCAIPQYEALVKENPEEKSYWAKLAYLYYKEDDCKAVQAQQKVVDLDPNDVEASRLLAEIMFHCGEDPIKALEDTYNKDPKNAENAMRYGKAAFERGLYQKAIEPFEQVLKQDPKNTAAMEYIGRCYEGLNQLSKALTYYKNILQIDPKNLNVLCLTASVYGRLNDFETARRYVYNAERVDPGSGLPHVIMAEVYENAITYCSEKRSDKKLSYDDKLVYSYAQDELRKATKDPVYGPDAQKRMVQFDTLIPSTEDYFMHKNRKTTTDKCYNWINQ